MENKNTKRKQYNTAGDTGTGMRPPRPETLTFKQFSKQRQEHFKYEKLTLKQKAFFWFSLPEDWDAYITQARNFEKLFDIIEERIQKMPASTGLMGMPPLPPLSRPSKSAEKETVEKLFDFKSNPKLS